MAHPGPADREMPGREEGTVPRADAGASRRSGRCRRMVAEEAISCGRGFDCSRSCQDKAPSRTRLSSRPLRPNLRPPLCVVLRRRWHIANVPGASCASTLEAPSQKRRIECSVSPEIGISNANPFDCRALNAVALRCGCSKGRDAHRHCSCFRSSAPMKAWSIPGWRSDSVAAAISSFGVHLPRRKIVARSAR